LHGGGQGFESLGSTSKTHRFAGKNGIIEQAQTNAEDSLRAFVISLGYEEVIFT